MPLTLEKLFSKTLDAEIVFMGETVNVEWAPTRYTGEMDELADELIAANDEAADQAIELEAEAKELDIAGDEEGAAGKRRQARRAIKARERRDKGHVRRLLAELLVSWDLMSGDVPYPTSEEALLKLPDGFLTAVFLGLAAENRVDPTKAPNSPDTSSTKESSAPKPTGTDSSDPLTTLASRRGTSRNGLKELATTQSGGAGPS